MTKQQRIHCAICGLRCAPGDRVTIELRLADGSPQHLFVHWQCLRNTLHADVALLEVDAYQHNRTAPDPG